MTITETSRSEFITLRGLRTHVRQWGDPGAPKLFMLHGWMDVAASFQFLVDAFQRDWHVIAMDWRGFGETDHPTRYPGTASYWFPDYVADLEGLIDHYQPDGQVDLVGHSMGGNVAMMYAGARPERIRRLVNLEGFGMPATRPAQAPGRYARWMDELKKVHSGAMALKAYDSLDGVAQRLMKTNPRLGADKARWLAQHWAHEVAGPEGQSQWQILGEAGHKVTSAQLYRVDEALELYARISAPLLAVEASDDSLGQWWKDQYTLDEYHQRLQRVPDCRVARIADAGHMLHHDQPEALAARVADFLG